MCLLTSWSHGHIKHEKTHSDNGNQVRVPHTGSWHVTINQDKTVHLPINIYIYIYIYICIYTSNPITVTSKWVRLFTQSFIPTQIKDNKKAPSHWPLCEGIHPGPVNSPQKWPVTRKMFSFDDIIMSVEFSTTNQHTSKIFVIVQTSSTNVQ